MQTLTTAGTANHSPWSKIAGILAFISRIRMTGQAAIHSREQRSPAEERPECGGYNEAFVIQYWTGYNPRH